MQGRPAWGITPVQGGWPPLEPLGGLGFGPCRCAWAHPQLLSPGPNPEGQRVPWRRPWTLPHRPSQRRALSSPQHPPRCTPTVVAPSHKTAVRPPRNCDCSTAGKARTMCRRPGVVVVPSWPRVGLTWLRDHFARPRVAGPDGHLGLVAGRCYSLDVPRRSAVTGWHPGQSVVADLSLIHI